MRLLPPLLVTLSLLTVPTAAYGQEAGTASLSGRVVDAAGAPVADACVRAHQGYYEPQARARTAADGSYRLDGLRAGLAEVLLDPCQTTSAIAPQWYRDAARSEDAQAVELAEGQQRLGIDMTARRESSVSGRVTDTDGNPLGDVCVQPLPDDRSNSYRFDLRSTRTDADGRYRLDRLPSHPFTVRVLGCSRSLPTTYAPGTGDPNAAAVHTPPAEAELAGVDVRVPLPAVLRGVVRDTDGRPLARQCVEQRTTDDSRGLERTTTDADGRWALPGLAPGTYGVRVEDCERGLHLPRWHDGAAWVDAPGGGVPLRAGEDRALPDVALPPAGAVAGSVVDDTGAPAPVGCVYAYADGQDPRYSPVSERHVVTRYGTGSYVLGGLRPGRYTVSVAACADGHYFGGTWVGGDDRRSTARVLEVTGGQVLPADTVLPRPARFSGTVRDEVGVPARACVLSDDFPTASTKDDGTYVSQPLYPRTRTVSFAGRCDPGVQGGDAREITLLPGETTPGVDGQVALAVGLSGHVRDVNGNPVAACITATGAGGRSYHGFSNSAGGWRLDGLAPDAYAVLFRVCRSSGPNLAPTYHPGVPELSRAVRIPLGTTAVTGIDTVMLPGRQLTGRVTGPDGAPYADACVSAYRVAERAPAEVVGGRTDTDGRYTIGALGAGTYQVRAEACRSDELPGAPAPTWFPGSTATRAAASLLTVTAEDRTGVDLRLLAGGILTGRLVDSAGRPIPGCVQLGTSEQVWQRFARADEGGRWRLNGIGTSADARLRLDDCGRQEYVVEQVDPLATRGGGTEDRGEVVLLRAGSTSGTVRDEQGRALRGVCVVAGRDGYATTAADGSWSVRGLRPEPTLVRFHECGGPDLDLIVPEHWRDAVSAADATPVDVREGQDTGGIDAVVRVVSVPGVVRDVRAALGVDRATVSWTEPADDGGAAIERYVVRSATTGASLAVVDGVRRSALITGLVGPGDVAFTVEAVNRKGAGERSAASAPAPLLLPSTLRLSAPTSLPVGSSASLVATLGRPGQSVRLLAGTAAVASAVTDAAGVARFTVRPARTTRYTATYAGDLRHGPATAVREVRVVPRVVARPVAGTVSLGSSVVVAVTTAGLPPRQRTVLQVRRADGTWLNVATGYLGSTGAVRLAWRPARRGTSVLRVVVPLAAGYSTTYSGLVGVRVV